ncbi:hypothetical protein V8G54_028973 [Vigna mungo]|uniref:SLH domain-containing protein n=1 Tax=Vigna mungo TaxID=3915 RepID=A0AAQ3RL03_VIGMU
MASITTPGSLQIRLAFTPFNSTKINPIFFHTRFTNVDHRRVRLLCVANHGNGSGSVPIRSGSDNRSVSEFKKNQSYGGVVGVGVAGIFLLSGIAFAAFLVSMRNGARQVKPLNTHQGVLLSSDDCNDKTENVNADNRVEQGDINVEGHTDISRGCLSPESDKIPNGHRIVNDFDIESQLVRDIHNIDDNADAIIYISVQEELQHGSVVDDGYVVPREGTVALNDPESETPIDSLDSYRFKDFDSSSAVDTDNSTTELKENPSFIEPRNMSNIDAEPLPIICEQQDEIIGSSGNRSSATFDTLSFVADDESVPVNIDFSTQSNKTTSDPEVFLEEDDPSVSTKGNLDLNNMPQVSDKSSFEEQNFSEDDLLTKSKVSSINTFVDGQVKNDDNEVNKSRSESSNPGAFYSAPGIPAPSVVSAAVEVFPGKVLVPAVVDQGQGQALAALQALNVIESDVEPSDLCTRREYARWLVSASSALSRKTISKVFPAMYIENVTELAFDDITSEDPDFSSIQGLAEAGLIESRLSRSLAVIVIPFSLICISRSPLSRQDLVSWKMVLEKRQLPEADGKMLYQLSGFIDAGKIHSDVIPALVADVSAGEHGITALAFGHTRLFQPHKPVTKAQAAVALATGDDFDIANRELARVEAESLADNAVASHSVLVAQVEKDINASFEQKLSIEREKISVVERLARDATCELERLRAEREEDRICFIKERAAIESERVVFSRLRLETEDHLQNIMSDKVKIAHEKERISKLRELAENEEKEIKRVQYELEVERKALSMARAWAEDEAKRVSAYAVGLERARDRWERNGIKAVDDNFLEEQLSVKDTSSRYDDEIILIISQFVSRLKEWISKSGKQAEELRETLIAKAGKSAHEAKRVAGDCIERVEKLTQNFRT